MTREDKRNTLALTKIVSGNLTAQQLTHDLALAFAWKWEWSAKENGPGMFLTSAARIGAVSPFSSVIRRGSGAQVDVSRWTPETMASGKLHTVWVGATGVPDTMKGYFGLCEVGSTLGVVILEIDMALLRTHDLARIKVGVRDPFKIHFKTLTTPKLLTYGVYFTVEYVVEIGWSELRKEKYTITIADDLNVNKEPGVVMWGLHCSRRRKSKPKEGDSATNLQA